MEPIALYTLLGHGEWRKVWEYILGESCERCGGPFLVNIYGRTTARRYIDSTFGGTVKEAPVICSTCNDKDVKARRQIYIEQQERKELARLQALYSTNE